MSLANSRYAATAREYWRACQAVDNRRTVGPLVSTGTAARMLHNTARRGAWPLLRRLAADRCHLPAEQLTLLPDGAA